MSWPDNPVLDQDRSDIPINENFDALKAKADEHAATLATQSSTLATNTSAIASHGARLTTAEGTLVTQGGRLGTAETTLTAVDGRTHDLSAALTRWFRGGIASKKIVFLGDSTTSNAVYMFNRLTGYHNDPGGALYGVTDADFVNQGNNGLSLEGYLAGSGGTYTLANAYAAAGDLYVISYGINDVRLGLTSQAQLTARLTTLVDLLRANVPNADIILRIPNPLLTEDVGGNHWVTSAGGTVNPAGAAQDYTDRMYYAYKALENKWPNVVIWDTQRLIFGRTSDTLANSVYMVDQLHPNQLGYEALANSFAGLFGVPSQVVSSIRADRAVTGSASAPWLIDPSVLEDTSRFELIADAKFENQDAVAGTLDLTWAYAGRIKKGDIIRMGNYQPFALSPTGSYTFGQSTATSTRITGLSSLLSSPAKPMTSGPVRIYRRKAVGDSKIEALALRVEEYPYRRLGYVNGGATNTLDIVADPNEDRLAKFWRLAVGDIVQIEGQSPITLTSAQLGAASGNNLRILSLSTGVDYTTLVNSRVIVVGNHLRERGLTISVAVDPGNVTANSTLDVDVTVTGILATDLVIANPPVLAAGLTYDWARVKADNTITVRFRNLTGADIDDSSRTWLFQGIR